MKYVQYVNSLLKGHVNNTDHLVLYGQNIDAGSCLGGLTRGLSTSSNSATILNTPNSENCLVGVGFGLMMNDVPSIFFMKQLDFLLLGIDQIVNTYNIMRQSTPSASFTIFPITMDSGYEGPQASLNNLDDFCSIAGVEGYSITNKIDAKEVLARYLTKPGFRIISVGQRLLQQDMLDIPCVAQDENANYFQYMNGDDATIVCFNNALQYGYELHSIMQDRGLAASLFSVNAHLYKDYSLILADIGKTSNLILIDDTKSRNRLSDQFLIEVLNRHRLNKQILVTRPISDDIFEPRKDLLDIDYDKIIDNIVNNSHLEKNSK
jgi:pyruvate/2-oxoglutarate/acetoin dehydrogenase E1 component